MKMIILAAGKGERLYPLTRNTPKPLLDMGNGKTLLEEQLERMKTSIAIDEIVLVTGYLSEQIEAKMDFYKKSGMAIRTIYNPFFDVANNLMSLWFAKNEMTSPFMVTNGDNIFESSVFSEMASTCKSGIYLAASKKTLYDDDDMKISFCSDGRVERVKKDIPPPKTDAESPGLMLVDGLKEAAAVKRELERLAHLPEARGWFWLELFNSLSDHGIIIKPWLFDASNRWQEIDIHLDIARAMDIMKLKLT